MRYNKQQLIIVTIVVAVLLVPAIIWIGLGYAGDSSSVKLPAVSTIGPEMKPYVLTALEKEKRHLPEMTSSVSMDFGNAVTETRPDMPRQHRQWAPKKTEAFSTIEYIPRAPGIEGLTPQERAKLEAYLKSRNK